MTEFKSADSERQRWEDQVNASFSHIKSTERVCYHADCTVSTRSPGVMITECDYCPAQAVSITSRPEVPAPVYLHDPDPLFL